MLAFARRDFLAKATYRTARRARHCSSILVGPNPLRRVLGMIGRSTRLLMAALVRGLGNLQDYQFHRQGPGMKSSLTEAKTFRRGLYEDRIAHGKLERVGLKMSLGKAQGSSATPASWRISCVSHSLTTAKRTLHAQHDCQGERAHLLATYCNLHTSCANNNGERWWPPTVQTQ